MDLDSLNTPFVPFQSQVVKFEIDAIVDSREAPFTKVHQGSSMFILPL